MSGISEVERRNVLRLGSEWKTLKELTDCACGKRKTDEIKCRMTKHQSEELCSSEGWGGN